jgi:histidinol-phosphate aminotransferase
VLDLAYTEFADEDLTPVGLAFPNVVCIRTLSKAWGLAGLRVGYAVGDERVITWIRSAGGPYAVSGPSAAIACRALDTCAGLVRETVERVRVERAELVDLLRSLGATPWESRANFVTARFPDAEKVWRNLGERGIAVRFFGARPHVENCLRITCPGRAPAFDRVTRALKETLA